MTTPAHLHTAADLQTTRAFSWRNSQGDLRIFLGAVVQQLESYLETAHSSCFRNLKHKLFTDWRAESDFKILQLLFECKFHLHPNFDYVMYIKGVLEANVVSIANISTAHWIMICMVNVVWYVSIGAFAERGFDDQQLGDVFQEVDARAQSQESPAGRRRQLGGSAEVAGCRASMLLYDSNSEPVFDGGQCNIDSLSNATRYAEDIEATLDVLRSNGTYGYAAQCDACWNTPQGLNDITASQTQIYVLVRDHHNMNYPPTRWPITPRIVMQFAP